MSSTHNRLEEIADRQRHARVMDLVFAALIAFLMIWSVASLRIATAKADSAGLRAHAPAKLAACDVDVDVTC
jgi:hypothetical protein